MAVLYLFDADLLYCIYALQQLLVEKPETKWQVPDFVITIGIHK
ncbi:hypothetical protein [Photobacterium iliopiscarium]|nr:hypothetical protein [Photobacterium iliopiscarium]